jgi:predicted transcriptional regulator
LPEPARPGTKKALMFEMLRQPAGSSILELANATGWKPNTVHSTLTTMRKQGFEIACEGAKSVGRYRLR